MAIVINEHGGNEGIVTLEDLIEELVGEIWNETGRGTPAVRRHEDGSLTVAGSFPLHDLPDLGIDLPSGRYATIAGFLLDRLKRIPEVGETVTVRGWELRVEEASRRAVRRVHLRKKGDGSSSLVATSGPRLRRTDVTLVRQDARLGLGDGAKRGLMGQTEDQPAVLPA